MSAIAFSYENRRQARVPSVSQQNPDVEPELENIVRKTLAKDPNQRYQRAERLLAKRASPRRVAAAAATIAEGRQLMDAARARLEPGQTATSG